MSAGGHCLAALLLVCVFTTSLDSTSGFSTSNFTRSTSDPGHGNNNGGSPRRSSTAQGQSGRGGGYCQINTRRSDQLPRISPLLLRTDKPEFLHPETSQFVYVDSHQKVRLVCPGEGNVFSLSKGTPRKLSTLTPECVKRDSFKAPEIREGEIIYKDFGCDKEFTATAVPRGTCPDKKSSHIQIGFKLPQNEFVPTIDLCFDQTNYDALYSKVTLIPGIEYRQYWTTRPDTFSASTFYNGIGIDELYLRFKQRETIGNILGSRQLAERYIPKTHDTKLYLARGHLTAMADLIYGAEERSTFFYVNVAPQWQSFNEGNWKKLEESARGFAASRNSKLEMYTGTWGNCNLEDQNGRLQPLYLHVDKNKNRAVRVPGYFWKVLYDPETKEGAAFVGINNPFVKDVNRQVFCTDICDNFKWLQWEPHNVEIGYSFCCSVDDFRKTVNILPNLEVTSIFRPESKNCKSVESCSKPHVRPSRNRPPGQ